MRWIMGFAALALAACAGGPQPQTLAEATDRDWGNAPGAALNADFSKDVRRLLKRMPRADAIAAIEAEGYACQYGEAHEDYPEPMALCTRSFATRACQMDWEMFVTSDPKKPGRVNDAGASFTRDCVGRDRDWPEAKDSAIDDGLAPGLTP